MSNLAPNTGEIDRHKALPTLARSRRRSFGALDQPLITGRYLGYKKAMVPLGGLISSPLRKLRIPESYYRLGGRGTKSLFVALCAVPKQRYSPTARWSASIGRTSPIQALSFKDAQEAPTLSHYRTARKPWFFDSPKQSTLRCYEEDGGFLPTQRNRLSRLPELSSSHGSGPRGGQRGVIEAEGLGPPSADLGRTRDSP